MRAAFAITRSLYFFKKGHVSSPNPTANPVSVFKGTANQYFLKSDTTGVYFGLKKWLLCFPYRDLLLQHKK